MAEEKWDSIKKSVWKYSPNTSLGSPMTCLALNLEESASLRDTPKRRISWSNESITSSPICPELNSILDETSPNSSFNAHASPSFATTTSNNRTCKGDSWDRVSIKSSSIQRSRLIPATVTSSLNKENIAFCERFASSEKSRISDDQEGNSRDSGFSDKHEEMSEDFIFAEPVGMPPRRHRTPSEEYPQNLQRNSICSPMAETCEENKVFDDGFLDEIDASVDFSESSVPSGLAQLIKGKLVSQNSTTSSCSDTVSGVSRPPFHDLCNINVDTPKSKSCIRGLFGASKQNSSDKKNQLKRHEAPRDSPSPVQSKRRRNTVCGQRSDSAILMEELKIVPKKYLLQRAFSETHADIMRAVQKSVQEPNLIGDCSRPYVLPLIDGKHQDLKMISHDTIKSLLDGTYLEEVEKFVIVDCRYPYEYEGGHIRGAVNTYTKEGIINQFLCNPIRLEGAGKRLIVIFHCEFSSERAPNLSRFLRNRDREANKECYPHLYYPEIYVIEGGYKMFYEHHQQLCEPQNYMPMLHKDHETDLRHFRAKSKSWNGDKGNLRFGGRPSGLNI